MKAFYIYGIMREADLAGWEPERLLPGRSMAALIEKGMAAVVGAARQEKYESAPEALLEHFGVVSCLMKRGAVFPIRFGTVAQTEEEVRHLLASLDGFLDQALERLAGKVEFDVEARWNPAVAYPRMVEADPVLKEFRGRFLGQGSPPSLEDRLQMGKLVAEAAAHQACLARQKIKDILGPIALVMTPLPQGKDKDVFLNAAFFVEEGKGPAFEQALQTLGASFQESVHLKYAGPLPSYSFTGCEIAMLPPERLEEARQILELGETFSREECIGQYRKLALAWHPDRRNGDPRAAERFNQITEASKLLVRFLDHDGHPYSKDRLPERILLVMRTVDWEKEFERA